MNESRDDREGRTRDLGFARVDHDRARRRGFPEVIYGPGKSPEQIGELMVELASRNPNVLCTRVDPNTAETVRARLHEFDVELDLEFDAVSGLLYVWRERDPVVRGKILVVSAGTSDQKVAREAELSARIMGNRVDLLQDVGVAGLHRLLEEVPRLRDARVIIAVAGLEAALPSVVAGLVECPVIGVPTSVGYGTALGGWAALLGILNSCSGGITAVNIDNGFGAAQAASLMNRS